MLLGRNPRKGAGPQTLPPQCVLTQQGPYVCTPERAIRRPPYPSSLNLNHLLQALSTNTATLEDSNEDLAHHSLQGHGPFFFTLTHPTFPTFPSFPVTGPG